MASSFKLWFSVLRHLCMDLQQEHFYYCISEMGGLGGPHTLEGPSYPE